MPHVCMGGFLVVQRCKLNSRQGHQRNRHVCYVYTDLHEYHAWNMTKCTSGEHVEINQGGGISVGITSKQE